MSKYSLGNVVPFRFRLIPQWLSTRGYIIKCTVQLVCLFSLKLWSVILVISATSKVILHQTIPKATHKYLAYLWNNLNLEGCEVFGYSIRIFGYSIRIFKFILIYANLCKLYANCSLCMQICKNVVLISFKQAHPLWAGPIRQAY